MGRLFIFAVGTRAQLIKVAPVIVACEHAGLETTLFMTGQHHETMQDLILEFGIRSPQVHVTQPVERSTIFSLLQWLPKAYWGIRKAIKEAMIARSAEVDVLVHGDTLSTLVSAIAAKTCGARVVHLESGLSSGKLFDPFPEELFRRLVFRMTDIAVCPNAEAAAHMRRGGHSAVLDTCGNSIVDAVRLTGAAEIVPDVERPYILASLHRFQNLYDQGRLRELVELIENLANSVTVRFVLHPATRGKLVKAGFLDRLSAAGVELLPRMKYGDFVRLAAGALCVLTDGGSNQEELAALGVPTIIMRARTERPDGLGANALLEGEVPGGVLAFVLDGRVSALRHAPAALDPQGPSYRIARYFLENSGYSART